MPAALSGALCIADAARRRVSRAQRRHLVGGGNVAAVPPDTRHAKPPHSRYALSRRRRRNSRRRRDKLAPDPLVPSSARSLVERRAPKFFVAAERKRRTGRDSADRTQ